MSVLLRPRMVAAQLVLASAAIATTAYAFSDETRREDRQVCKRTQQTGTRFDSRICRRMSEWRKIEEESRAAAKETIDRPWIETRRE